MKRVLCGRTPWSTKKQQRSADSCIDGWISDHGYESGNDMYGYPMIWKWDGDRIASAHKLKDYDGLCDEVQEALEKSKSEKAFKDELDDIIDNHLGFVSDSEIAEMEGNNPFESDSDDKDHEEDAESQENNIICLDDYSEDEIRSMNLLNLAKKHKLLYHNVVYGEFVNLCVEDVYDDSAVVDLPVLESDSIVIMINKKKKFDKLTILLPNRVNRINIDSAGCNILDLSNCRCEELSVGSGCWDINTCQFPNLQTIVLPQSPSACRRIEFDHKCLIKSKVSDIVNSENIDFIGVGAFERCKYLQEISLSSDVDMYDSSFDKSNLKYVNWYGDITNSILKPFAEEYVSYTESLDKSEELPFEGCPYQDYFIENYVDPYLDEMNN